LPTIDLPPPVSGQRHEIESKVGRLTYYAASTGSEVGDPPLLMIHSINAAGSAYEVKPLYEHYRNNRTVYALELPGFGHSQRGAREYTVRMMTDAIHAVVERIQASHGRAPIDALAVSLSCEFLARAITETPLAFRSAALVSPTGFTAKTRPGAGDTSRAMPWLHAIFEGRLWSRTLWNALSSRRSIRFFLKKTFGSQQIDEGLADYDYITTHQPGARHAPFYFVSGYLFSTQIMKFYMSLTLPVWMTHGTRGDFTDYSNKTKVEGRANWRINVMDTGAMPHFERTAEFIGLYDDFLATVPQAPTA
jgi:pimeloyl-ACP methyl ester carboxylesterase